MRVLFIIFGLVAPLLTAAAQEMKAIQLFNTISVPVRVVAKWLGADMTFDPQGGSVTITYDNSSIKVWSNRSVMIAGKDEKMTGPSYIINGRFYIPANAIAKVFKMAADFERINSTLTLSAYDLAPISFIVTDFPRPECVTDDTLAGLTPGDNFAFAVGKFGDPIYSEKDLLPGSIKYEIPIDNGVKIMLGVKDNRIIYIHIGISGDLTLDKIENTLMLLQTTYQARLCHKIPDEYGTAHQYYSHYSDDVVIDNYYRNSLTLICVKTLWKENVLLTEMTLVKKGFPKKYFDIFGPV